MNSDLEATRPALGLAGLVGRLRGWLRVRPAAGRPAALGRLAIDGLPDEWTTLESGGLYAIYAAARTPACDALLWESAHHARTRDVTLVLARDAMHVADRLRECGFTGAIAAPGWPRNLNALAMPGSGDARDAAAPPGQHHAPPPFARLSGGLRALKRYGFRTRALYFVEGAERWFSWDDSAALAEEGRALADWCRAQRIAVVLLLDPAAPQRDGGADPDDAPLVRDARRARRSGFHSVCAGVAQLQRTHGELLWVVDFWRVGDALAAGEVRPLRFAPGGRLSAIVDADANVPARQMKLASDEDRVVVSRAVVERTGWVPGDWEIVDDNAAVVAACRHAHAATAVLAFGTHAQLEALCADVHMLRRRCGGALKIAVVERGEVLRHQFEMLLLSVGANSIVGRDLPFSRLQSAVRAMHGQLHARPVAADYRAALAAALGDAVLGYLPVGAFCLRIRAVLDRGAVLALPHTLVKMTLLPGVAHVDALWHCRPRRSGDVVTADAEHLYVFLFACEPADADDALKFIFDVPVGQLSDRIVRLAHASIDAELDALKAENRRAPIADYSDLFAATRSALDLLPAEEDVDAAGVPDALEIDAPFAEPRFAPELPEPEPSAPEPSRPRTAIRSAMPLRTREVE